AGSADLLANHDGVAPAGACFAARVRRRQTVRFELRSRLLQKVIDLVVRVGIRGAWIPECAKSPGERPPAHGYISAFSRRAMAPARRLQSAVSTSSCFSPLRVNE